MRRPLMKIREFPVLALLLVRIICDKRYRERGFDADGYDLTETSSFFSKHPK